MEWFQLAVFALGGLMMLGVVALALKLNIEKAR